MNQTGLRSSYKRRCAVADVMPVARGHVEYPTLVYRGKVRGFNGKVYMCEACAIEYGVNAQPQEKQT
jgi:hypothetical protein